MHAGIRRVPVERARHAKRLGHVQAGSGPAFPILADTGNGNGTTTATQQTPSSQIPTITSATHSSSSALTSSSTTPSSPSALSSATASLASSSTGVQSLTVPTLSLSLSTPPAVSTSTSPTSSSVPTPPTSAAAATSSGLSGGAIAGIIAGAAVVGAALIVFFVRKTYLRRRERKRISWNGAPGLGAGILDEPKFPDISERPATSTVATNTQQRIPPPSPFEARGQSMYSTPVSPLAHMHPPTIPTYAAPAPPQATYNNPTYPTHPVPSPYNSGNPAALAMARGAPGTGIPSTLSSARAQHAPAEATVKCSFVPTLPDELSITTGERVFIVEQYDDGWDLCANVRGERGMIPRECLEHAPIDQPDVGWRNVGRASSLNPDGRRF